ncbi:hypothetical protein ACEOIM_27455 [Pseudomonas aeruginosa]|jgi:hypothetical protein|uniref:Uncharacterized protein n=1 Tax=Ectopseudomonas toyotomiensis TaxID=554344 RepID=A0AA42IM80_9GAMM|nr:MULTISPECIES: hypothetical protein [Pseudomonadaceae]MBA1263130.1 hypothetical protein [Stutzerimonas stutzeri]MBA5113621.1 hypothetical protein [Pseudomonas aeruginosa]MBG0842209.1 hypothetical protein [Pseudomonas toyotomiensis]MDH0702067.1 hypothetical protein [Pseudomonas toyotomiensis]MDH1559475.1 hypothetical protein [Pseudomonas chengduensis]
MDEGLGAVLGIVLSNEANIDLFDIRPTAISRPANSAADSDGGQASTDTLGITRAPFDE